MLNKMEDVGRQLSAHDLESLEESINAKLPGDYKLFLLKYNGGVPAPKGFPIQGMPKNPVGILQEFFGIDQAIESSNLLWNYTTMKSRFPSNLLPIAGTGSGDLICLELGGDKASAVIFWDSYHETQPPSYDNVYRIADNFTSFINSIHPD